MVKCNQHLLCIITAMNNFIVMFCVNKRMPCLLAQGPMSNKIRSKVTNSIELVDKIVLFFYVLTHSSHIYTYC